MAGRQEDANGRLHCTPSRWQAERYRRSESYVGMYNAKTMRRALAWPCWASRDNLKSSSEEARCRCHSSYPDETQRSCNSPLRRLGDHLHYRMYDNDVTSSYKSLRYLRILSTSWCNQPVKPTYHPPWYLRVHLTPSCFQLMSTCSTQPSCARETEDMSLQDGNNSVHRE